MSLNGESLQQKLDRVGDPLIMLRDNRASRFKFPYPAVHTNWQDEQKSWTTTATLFDQSHHMTDVYFEGPDVTRLLRDTGTNSFRNWGAQRAKHFVACTAEGYMIGTAVLFGFEANRVSLVGPSAAANWLQYLVETGDYDVEVHRDERTADSTRPRLTYRYEIEGPNTRAILEKAQGRPLADVKFFGMTEFTIAGRRVEALSHTMAGVPGSSSMGFEIWGPLEDGPAVLDALLAAGEEFGLVRGGALAYYTGSIESGYMAQPTPGIYTSPDLRGYREWLPGGGYEGTLSVGGSFAPERLDDFYVTPYEFGYDHLVKFDHDFIGRSALEAIADRPHPKKVWLHWHDDDVTELFRSSLFDDPEERAKYLDPPLGRYARVQADAVLYEDRQVGISNMCGYTVNARAWISVAMIEPELAVDGQEVVLLWGEEGGGTSKLAVERHRQRPVRATVRTSAPVH